MATAGETSGQNYHHLRQAVFRDALRFVEASTGRKGRLIDLGAGHCQFSLMAQKDGWDVTALDARDARVPELPSDIPFIKCDVLSDDWDANDYDFISCLGLYYYLNQEQQHTLLRKCKGRTIILDTHFAVEGAQGSDRYRQLGPTTHVNGEEGAIFLEDPDLSDEDRKEKSHRSSFENRDSWWQTQKSLYATLNDFGWAHIWTLNFPGDHRLQRTFFICQNIDFSNPVFR